MAATTATPKADHPKPAPRKLPEPWMQKFLDSFAVTGLVIAAAETVGVSRTTIYRNRQRHEEFALAWAEVEQWTTEELEQEAKRRALDGSDTLLIFLLKARKPEMYRDRYEKPDDGSAADRVGFTMHELMDEEQRELAGEKA